MVPFGRCIHVYHYDYRGSVIAVTDIDGNITDTLKYDAYGKVSERTGNSSLIFGYNGRYGVLTDPSGLLYMRTRYYSPDFKRFMSADIIDGSITDSTTLNVFAYVNGNPISFVDPFGLSAERGENNESVSSDKYILDYKYYPYFSSYAQSGSIVYNPWDELDYPGEIHNAVVSYLAEKYGLVAEHSPVNNKHHRVDLYSIRTNTYWEVKPVSYITDGSRHEAMMEQMKGYDSDGIDRGVPLGRDEIIYNEYTIKIYSDVPGEIYYTFSYNTETSYGKERVPSLVPSATKDLVENADWEAFTAGLIAGGLVIAGASCIIFGFFTGIPDYMFQGEQMIQGAF